MPVCRFLFDFQGRLVLFHSIKEQYVFTVIQWLSSCILLRKTVELPGKIFIVPQFSASKQRFTSSSSEGVCGVARHGCVQVLKFPCIHSFVGVVVHSNDVR